MSIIKNLFRKPAKDYGYLGGAGNTYAEDDGCLAPDTADYQDLSRAETILFEVLTERSAQVEKWGVQYHPGLTGTTTGRPSIDIAVTDLALVHYRAEAEQYKAVNDATTAFPETKHLLGWDTILLEEVFEALEQADNPQAQREELVQVAAVAAAMIENIDRTEAGE